MTTAQQRHLPYTLHWDVISTESARVRTGHDRQLLAIWPSPARAGTGFEEAGFTTFGDQDVAWERNTTLTVDRLLATLASHGAPTLSTPPLRRNFPFLLRLFITEKELPMSEQVKMPMFTDAVPACAVLFGEAGVSLRTGGGRALWWVELPAADDAAAFVERVAAGLPVVRTALAWERLL